MLQKLLVQQNVSTAKPATDSEASRSVTASTASSTTASSVSASANNVTVSETANVPRVRSRRAVGQERAQDRSMEGKDIRYVYQIDELRLMVENQLNVLRLNTDSWTTMR